MEQNKMEQRRTDLFKKKEILNNAVEQLKKEFVGLDNIIDQITTTINSWFFFPEMQDRPIIVNLWGLTGIGKTSLIKRLTELIGFSNQYFRFDLGLNSGEYFDIQDSFKDIYENCDGEPFIIGLDEFQLARTINEDREEVDRSSTRAIWDLLDCGKFDILDFAYNMSWLNKLIKKLDKALFEGVEVEKGLIKANKDIFDTIVREMTGAQQDDDEEDENEGKKSEKPYFISEDDLQKMFYMVDKLFLSKNDLRTKLDELDGDQTIDYLIHLYKQSLKPKTVDCTKALVFVMGNLDEVYSMTRNFNPDISADEFHRQSTEITITEVKEALLSRFRSEQIARLGNNHIIYPSFNQNSFYAIIRLELEKIRKKVYDIYGVNMLFDATIEQLIYQEGVYPTQGTRPLFTTIHQIINTRLGKILNEIYINGFIADSLVFTISESDSTKDNMAVRINFIKDGTIIHHIIDQQALVLGKLRMEKQNDEQAIVAVHESGHAILSSILMKTIPSTVLSVTADSSSNGFVLARPEWNYVSKKEVINRLAVLLGGLVAERIIFGDNNVTMGSSSDLANATRLATYVYYACGMGNTRAAFGNEGINDTPTVIFDNSSQTVNKDAEKLLKDAEIVAQQMLEKQKVLLLHLANYLSDKRCADKETVRQMVAQYAVDFDINDIVEEKDADCLFYRNHLKQLVQEATN